MSANETTLKQAAPKATERKPLLLCCPLCHEPNAAFTINVADGTVECQECGDALEREELDEALAAMEAGLKLWRKTLAWFDGRPEAE